MMHTHVDFMTDNATTRVGEMDGLDCAEVAIEFIIMIDLVLTVKGLKYHFKGE